MTCREYASTADAAKIPKWSVFALAPTDYTVPGLSRFGRDHLKALAGLWVVSTSGSKSDLVERIIRRKQLREAISGETEPSLLRKTRKDLASMAGEAGLFHSALRKEDIVRQLVAWREAARNKARNEIAKARHENIVRRAARSGLYVPADNLRAYGLKADGQKEPSILGTPVSEAIRIAPGLIAAARALSQPEFAAWIEAHKQEAGRTFFIEPGSVSGGGVRIWHAVRTAFQRGRQGTLFE